MFDFAFLRRLIPIKPLKSRKPTAARKTAEGSARHSGNLPFGLESRRQQPDLAHVIFGPSASQAKLQVIVDATAGNFVRVEK